MSGNIPFRLAIRAEGEFVNAYFSDVGTMDGAILIGSMKRSVLESQPGLFDRWRELLQGVIAHVCVEVTGVAPTHFDVNLAPEHERAGRG